MDFVQTWQALLLSQTQLTQGLSHFTTSPSLAMKVADVLIDFLPPPNLPTGNPSPTKSSFGTPASISSPAKRGQVNPVAGFVLVLKLWGVVKNVLASSCLLSMAERVLDAVLVKKYPISEDERLQDAWTVLCSDLVATCFTHAVAHVLRSPPPSNGGDKSRLEGTGSNTRQDTRQGIWRVVAESWRSAAVGVDWETGVQLLMTAQR